MAEGMWVWREGMRVWREGQAGMARGDAGMARGGAGMAGGAGATEGVGAMGVWRDDRGAGRSVVLARYLPPPT